MKRFLLPILFCGFGLLATVGFVLPSLKSAMREHAIFRVGPTILKAPGLNPRSTNDLLITASPFLSLSVEKAYELRLLTGMFPAWIAVTPDPTDREHRQLVIREEIADEFTDASMEKRMRDGAIKIANVQREFERSTGRKVAILMVPTKVAGNRLQVETSEIAPADFRFFESSSGLSHVGGFQKQLDVESEIAKLGGSVISLIDSYKVLQASGVQLYPRAETHWTADVKISGASSLINKLLAFGLIRSACVNREPKISSNGSFTYWGDLFFGMGWQENFKVSRKFSSEVNLFKLEPPQNSNAFCEPIVLAGSSYSVSDLGGLTFADAIQANYLGKVENRAQPAKALFETLGILQHSDFPRNAIVVWEFPFRYLKRDI